MKSNRQTIRKALIRYFQACDTINGEMLIEYAAECAKLPTEPVSASDKALVTRYLRKLRVDGELNYEYTNGVYKKLQK